MLGITTLLAYGSTLIAGFFSFFVASNLFPKFVETTSNLSNTGNPEEKLLEPIFKIAIDPLMPVMTALVLAFLLGLGIAAIKTKALYNVASEFQKIMEKTISNVIIPLLPFYIMGIFANMTFAGEVGRILSVFWKVFLVILIMHLVIIVAQFLIASIVGKKNLFTCLKNQIPGYLTAIGTQSSAATIPVNLECSEKNGVSKGVREFVVPLCATIHLSGSTITLTACSITIMLMNGMPINFGEIAGFIAMLGVTMVAAPGVPGGAVMAALGLLQTNLHFPKLNWHL